MKQNMTLLETVYLQHYKTAHCLIIQCRLKFMVINVLVYTNSRIRLFFFWPYLQNHLFKQIRSNAVRWLCSSLSVRGCNTRFSFPRRKQKILCCKI